MNSLKTDDFDFELDESLIAQFPLKDRSSSKLLVVNRENFDLEHKNFKNKKKNQEDFPIFVLVNMFCLFLPYHFSVEIQ